MLRSKNHVLSLALLISVPAFAMQDGQQLVAAANQAVAPAPSADLLNTITLADAIQSKSATFAQLQQQEIVLAGAKADTSKDLLALTAQGREKLASKNKAIEGSKKTIIDLKAELDNLPAKTEDEIATLKANSVRKEAELKEKIRKEEQAQQALETEATKLQKQIDEGTAEAPKTADASKTDAPVAAPTKGWAARIFGGF